MYRHCRVVGKPLVSVQVGLRAIVQLAVQAVAANLQAVSGPRCLAAAHATAQTALDAVAAPLPRRPAGAASLALLQHASEQIASARQVPQQLSPLLRLILLQWLLRPLGFPREAGDYVCSTSTCDGIVM
jgi:hypothetical protein